MRNDLLIAIEKHMQANKDNPFVMAVSDADGNLARYAAWEGREDWPHPSAVSIITSETASARFDFDDSEFEWEMHIYSESLTELNMLADECRHLFSRKTITGKGCEFDCIWHEIVVDIRDEDTQPFHAAVAFSA